MPVCVAGMHRSETSMVARILNLAGLYIGEDDALLPPAPDNPEGFWEHRGFFTLNEQILSRLGGGWDLPPVADPGTMANGRLRDLQAEAEEVVRRFEGREPWGWKDPRNSLTLAFWRTVLPAFNVVLCVRNPLEVA